MNTNGHTLVQIALCDNAAASKPVEVPLPLTHAALLELARKKYKGVTKQSRLFDGVSGAEIISGAIDVELAAGGKIVCSGKAGWKGAERLRIEAADGTAAAEASVDVAEQEPSSCDSGAVAQWASPRAEDRASAPPVTLQFVSFSYDRGQPHDTLTNLNARVLHNPGRAAKGLTGLDRRLAREVLATKGAVDMCEELVQEALRQLQRLSMATDERPPSPVRLGVGCDRGRHRSVALAEAATAQLARKAEKARSGRNRPGLEALLKGVQVLEAQHRELPHSRGDEDEDDE